MKNNIVKNFSIVFIIAILAKFIAFFTELIITFYLGTTYQADAFNMINGIHQVIYPMLSVGIWTVFLPEYNKQIIKKGVGYSDDLANKTLNIFMIFTLLLTIILIIFSDTIVSLIAPGFNSETQKLTSTLVKISAPQYIFIVIAAFYSAMLQSHNKFFASQIREIATYIPLIIAAILFYQSFGIYVLAIGLLLGSLFRLLIQIPFINWGYKYKVIFDFKDSNIKGMAKKLPSVLMNSSVVQMNTLVDKILASTLEIGAVSSLSYGQRLTNVFSGLISSAITTTIYPTLSRLVEEDKIHEISKVINKTIYLISLIIIPISIFSIFYSKDIISLVFERGAFNHKSVEITAIVFACYSVGILFSGIKDIFDTIFYSFGDTKTPMKISFCIITVNISLNLLLINLLGIGGLAIASSISLVIGSIYSYLNINKIISLKTYAIISEIVKIILSSCAANLITYISNINVFPLLFILTFSLYVLLLLLFRSESLKILVSIVRRKN